MSHMAIAGVKELDLDVLKKGKWCYVCGRYEKDASSNHH